MTFNWDAITAVGTAALAVTGVVAVVYARSQLKAAVKYAKEQLDQNKELAKVQHLRDLNREFDSPPMSTHRQKLAELRLSADGGLIVLSDCDAPSEMYDVLNFFEHVGLLVRRGFLDPCDVWDTFSYWIFNLYADADGVISQDRNSDPNYYTNFTELVERLREIERARGGTADVPTRHLREFYLQEKQLPTGSPTPKRLRGTRTKAIGASVAGGERR